MITAKEAKANSQLASQPAPIPVILEAIEYRIRDAAQKGRTEVEVTPSTTPAINNYFILENLQYLNKLVEELQSLGYSVTLNSVAIITYGIVVSWK